MPIGPATLKVLHIASGDLWAGAEAQVANLLPRLARTPNVAVAAIVFNQGELSDRLRSAGVLTHVLDESLLSTWTLLRRVTGIVHAWQPHVVHTHRRKENLLGSLAATAAGAPVCLRTVHGLPEHDHQWWQLRRSAPRVVDDILVRTLQRRMVVVSDDLAARLRARYPRAIITVIPNGIDGDALRRAAVPPIELPPNEVHVAFVGRLVPVKRVDVFLRSAAELVRSGHETYRFHVIGDGPLKRDLAALCGSLRLEKHVTFHGFIPDTPRWIAAMDAIVLTSEHEGMPMSALEALALGTPVVAHAVGGLPALLAGSVSSSLFHALDPAIVAGAIVTTVEQADSGVSLPAAYEDAAMAAKYVSLYTRGCHGLLASA